VDAALAITAAYALITFAALRSRASGFWCIIIPASAWAVLVIALLAVIAVLRLRASGVYTAGAMLFAFVASVAFLRFGASRWMIA